jgi:hypothetical protein
LRVSTATRLTPSKAAVVWNSDSARIKPVAHPAAWVAVININNVANFVRTMVAFSIQQAKGLGILWIGDTRVGPILVYC